MNYAQRNMLPFRKKQNFSVTLVALIAVSCVCDFAAANDSPTIEEDRIKIFDNDNDAKQEILNLVAKEEAQIKNDELKDTPDDANLPNFNEESINMNSTEPFIFNPQLNSSLENSTASETIEESFNKSKEETVSHSEEDQDKIKENEFDHSEDLPVTNASEEPVESEKINLLERSQSNETEEERFSNAETSQVSSPQSDLPVTDAEQNNSTSLWEILINKVVPSQAENLETGNSTELVDEVIQNLPVEDEEENNQAPSTLDKSEIINNSSTFENSTLPTNEMPIIDEQVQISSESLNAENKTPLEVPDYFSHRLFLPSLAMSGVTEAPPSRNSEESDSAAPSSTNEENTFENSENNRDSVVMKNSTDTEHLEESTFNSEEARDDRISNDESNEPELDNTPYLDSNSEGTEETARSTTANESEGNIEESTRESPIHGDSEDGHRTETARDGVEIPHSIDENEPLVDNSKGTFLNNSEEITDEIPVPTQSEEPVAETEIPKIPSTYGLFSETSNSTVQEEGPAEAGSSNQTMAPLLNEESVRTTENQESNENTLKQNHTQKEIQRHIPAFWRRRLFPESFEGQFQPPLMEEKHEIQNLSAKDFVPENRFNLPIEKIEPHISDGPVLSEIKDQQENDGIPTSPVASEEHEGEKTNERATTDFHSTIENEQSEGYENQEGPNLDNTNTSNEEHSVGTPQLFTVDLQNYLNLTMESQGTTVDQNHFTEHDQFSNNNSDHVHDDNKTHLNSELHPENVPRDSLFSTEINNQENNYSKDSFEERQAENEQDTKFPIEKEINQFTSSPIETTEPHTSKIPDHQTVAINDISRTHLEESKPVNREVETNQPEKQEFTNEIIPEFSKQYHPETNIMRLPRSYAPEEEAELKRQISDIIENIKSPWTLKMIRDMLTAEIHELHRNSSEDSFKEERNPIENEAKRFTINELQQFNQPSKNDLIPSDLQEGPEDEQLGHKNEEVVTTENNSSTTNTMGEAKTPWEEVTEEYRKYQMLQNHGNKTEDSSSPSAETQVSTDEHVQSEKLENKSVFGGWMSSISSFLGLS